MLNRHLPEFVFLVFLFLPVFAHADVVFSEIMYNLPGADSGWEWVEIQNIGVKAEDLSGWKFFENEVNHTLIPATVAVIPPGGYAVIASNLEKFSADWPQFSGILLKSSFSLSNSGETFSLKNASGDVIVSLEYSASVADGDGNSLNLIEGMWHPRKASPGALASAERVILDSKKAPRNPFSERAVPKDDSTEPSKGQLGAVSNAATDMPYDIIPWAVALVAVIGIASGVVFLGKKQPPKSGYTIIEDHS